MRKEAYMPALARAGVGAAIGGVLGRGYGKSESDGASGGTLAGTIAGAAAGAAAGLGAHGFRKMLGKGHAANKFFSAGNALTGIGGLAAAGAAGYGGAALAKSMSPDTFRPDYLTNKERRENTDIQMLVQRYKDAGGNFSRMDPNEAEMLRGYINNPATNSRVMTSLRGPATKMAAYYQPTEMDLTNAAYHMQLRRALALRQLMAMQQAQQAQQIQYMGSASTPDEAAKKLRSVIKQVQPQQQPPTEAQARSMINQYMQAAGVDTDSSKSKKTVDKYDGKPPESKPKKQSQKPVKIKPKEEAKKTASLSLSDVNMLEKVAGEAYPTYYHQDGSISKDINGVEHVFSPSGILKTANVFSRAAEAYRGLGALGKGGVIGGGLLAAGGAAYGSKKLYDYLNRDKRTQGEKLLDAGKAALPSLIASYKAYQAMQDQINRAADPNANLVMQQQSANPVMAQLGLEGQRPGLTPEQEAQQLGLPPYAPQSQFDPRMQRDRGYQDIN